ncbi:C-C chemokine receptor type 3 [Colossoma macropomum]|uniref:C-C chemokine receptor type 3 n=1 Tax=Colossoma macropomum TaxID=42526 RepID=UPI001864FBBB|nr:C-C chemokine receptor type 3 [Colossoma macropomum]
MEDHKYETSQPLLYEYDSSVTSVSPCDITDITDFSRKFLPPFYAIIFIVSMLGNGLVLFIMYKFERLGTVTNIFLINLVVSNLIFTFTLPFQAVHQSSQWIFGNVTCKIVSSAYFLGFRSSILFLTLMSFDRYLAVVHVVVATKQRRSCYAFSTAAVVWSVSVLASLETCLKHEVRKDPIVGYVCQETETNIKVLGTYTQFILFFILPLVVIVYCYIRIALRVISSRMKGKHRTVKLIFVIVVLFFICWTPYNVILLIKEQELSDPCDNSLVYPQYVTHNIAHLYFCVNPVFYTFLGKKFQNHVRQLLVSKVPCLKSYLSFSGETSRSFS